MSFRAVLLFSLASSAWGWSEAWKVRHANWESPGVRGHSHIPGADTNLASSVVTAASDLSGNGTFKQFIDHHNPDLGTFDQFYFWSGEFWGGPGSPVVIFTPGEVNASGYSSYLTVNRTTGVMAQELRAAIFVLEHRYWGTSTPYTELTTANLTHLTLDNAIHDLTYFAQQALLPFAPFVPSTANDVPWIMSGGSYSGALSAWTASVTPGTYWAYHSSSAPVEAISDYASYFYPVQLGMPQNCSTDINLVIEYMDNVIANNNETQIDQLKALFMMQDVTHNDDFMAALENGPWLWQGNQFYTGYSPFFEFCDYIENAANLTNSTSTSTLPPSSAGVGLEKALHGYATWFTTIFLPNFCHETYGYPDFQGEYNTACFDTYNASSPLFRDTSPSNTIDRQWNWMLCNEPFGYWQTGAPLNRSSTLVSRLVDTNYWIRQCGLFFPLGPHNETYGIAKGRSEADVNTYTGGWNVTTTTYSNNDNTRVVFTNGEFDPWRESGVSSDFRPDDGPLLHKPTTGGIQPVNVVPGGFHTSDLITRNGEVNEGCRAVIDAEVAQIVAWVKEWPGPAPAYKSDGGGVDDELDQGTAESGEGRRVRVQYIKGVEV